jgi:hypothetical protein
VANLGAIYYSSDIGLPKTRDIGKC